MRRPIIAGNWKMNLLLAESTRLAEDVRCRFGASPGVEVVLAPSFTALGAVAAVIEDTDIALAAQNLWAEPKGAFTGEVSAPMLRELGCRYVLLGHSERRQVFGEDDGLIHRKIRTALDHGLKVIFCVGETLEQRHKNQTQEVVQGQLERGLQGLTAQNTEQIVTAYEPVWAIGTGKNATPQQAQEVHAFIRDHLKNAFGKERSENWRLLYGGSVTPENSAGLLQQPDIDGALVGSASLKADSFCDIIGSVS